MDITNHRQDDRSLGKYDSHDIPSVLRFLCITLIVANHFDFYDYGGGGSLFLLILIGYNIAKFKLPKTVKEDSSKNLLNMLSKVVIPAFIITLALNFLKGPFEVDSVLFISNFSTSHHPNGFSYWFIEIYIQIVLALSLIFGSNRIRQYYCVNKEKFSIIFLILSFFIYLLSSTLFDYSAYYQRIPWLMMTFIAIGFASYHSNGIVNRLVVLLLSTLFFYAFGRFSGINLFVLMTTAALIFYPKKLSLNHKFMVPINLISGASLYIYLTHFQFKTICEKIGIENIGVISIISIVAGVIFGYFYEKLIHEKLLRALKKGYENTFQKVLIKTN